MSSPSFILRISMKRGINALQGRPLASSLGHTYDDYAGRLQPWLPDSKSTFSRLGAIANHLAIAICPRNAQNTIRIKEPIGAKKQINDKAPT
jgi:hypothetical protein